MKLTEQDIYDQLKAILVQNFELKESDITPDAQLFTNLGLDSIDAVDLAIRVQELTGKRIRPDDFKHVKTVDDVVRTAYKLLHDR